MGKYNYDSSALKGLGVGAFLGEVKLRNSKIEEAPDDMPVSVFNANRLAASLHPTIQFGKVLSVTEHPGAKSFVIGPDPDRGTQSLAYFRAGQYISVQQKIGDAIACKPYTLRSCPKDALGTENTTYTLTIQRNENGFFSTYALDNWQPGSELFLSAPLGDFYYQRLRDARHVVALAGGSGVTPFFSMAAAIADGIEDFDLTILYGSPVADRILLKDELDAICARSNGKVKVVHVLSKEKKEGFENGFITADLIKKYAPQGDYSIFACGPGAMYKFLRTELPKLGLPARRVRFELSGEFGDPAQSPAYPQEAAGKTFNVTVRIRGEEQQLTCASSQTLLQAIEQAGIPAESECRSGQCGWCRSLLISGEVFVPESHDGRRLADAKFGWIHPCVTYPLSDIVMEVYIH